MFARLENSQQGPSEEQHPSVEGGFLPLDHPNTNVLQLPTDIIPLSPMERLFALCGLPSTQRYLSKLNK